MSLLYWALVVIAAGGVALIAVSPDLVLPRPIFVLVAFLLLCMSFFKPAGAWRAEFSITPGVALLLAFCFLYGWFLSVHERTDITLVYILGFAALIIGGQHLVEFGEAERTIGNVNTRLEETASNLITTLKSTEENIGSRVAQVVRTVRYKEYRSLVTDRYAGARRRVLASASHWPIDPQFWTPENAFDDSGFWESQGVYKNLREAIEAAKREPTSQGLRIVFAGRLDIIPTPGEPPTLSGADFLRFLGVLWRLALAWRLRSVMWENSDRASEEYRRQSDVRVIVADIPVSAHVIDDDAFLLLREPRMNERTGSEGIIIAEEKSRTIASEKEREKERASTFAEIIENYTRRHVRSARECAASIFVFAATARGDDRDDLILVERGKPSQANLTVLEDLLRTLGMDQWLKEFHGHPDTSGATRKELTERAVQLASDFFQHYYQSKRIRMLPSRQRYWQLPDHDERVTIDRLIEDLY